MNFAITYKEFGGRKEITPLEAYRLRMPFIEILHDLGARTADTVPTVQQFFEAYGYSREKVARFSELTCTKWGGTAYEIKHLVCRNFPVNVTPSAYCFVDALTGGLLTLWEIIKAPKLTERQKRKVRENIRTLCGTNFVSADVRDIFTVFRVQDEEVIVSALCKTRPSLKPLLRFAQSVRMEKNGMFFVPTKLFL